MNLKSALYLVTISLMTASCAPKEDYSLIARNAIQAIKDKNYDVARKYQFDFAAMDQEPYPCDLNKVEISSLKYFGIGYEKVLSYAEKGASNAQIISIFRKEIIERLQNIEETRSNICNNFTINGVESSASSFIREWVSSESSSISTFSEELDQADKDYAAVRWNERVRQCLKINAELNAPPENLSSNLRAMKQELASTLDCDRPDMDELVTDPQNFPRLDR